MSGFVGLFFRVRVGFLVVHHSLVGALCEVVLIVEFHQFLGIERSHSGCAEGVASDVFEVDSWIILFSVNLEWRWHRSIHKHLVGPLDAFVAAQESLHFVALVGGKHFVCRNGIVGDVHEIHFAFFLAVVGHIFVAIHSIVELHELVAVGIEGVFAWVVNDEWVGAHFRWATVAKVNLEHIVVAAVSQAFFIESKFCRIWVGCAFCHLTAVVADRSELVGSGIVAVDGVASHGHAFRHANWWLVATFFISAIFLVALCCDACRAVGEGGVDFRRFFRVVVVVEKFDSLEEGRLLEKEVTVCSFFGAHTVGGLWVDGSAISVGCFLVLIPPVAVVAPLGDLFSVSVDGLTCPTGPNLTCAHIPDIVDHIAVVGGIVHEVEPLVSIGIGIVACLQFCFPFCASFSHIFACGFHRRECHLVAWVMALATSVGGEIYRIFWRPHGAVHHIALAVLQEIAFGIVLQPSFLPAFGGGHTSRSAFHAAWGGIFCILLHHIAHQRDEWHLLVGWGVFFKSEFACYGVESGVEQATFAQWIFGEVVQRLLV